jgi:phage terminase large subunit-like protein
MLSPTQIKSLPFQYAADVQSGKITAGKKIKQAVARFYSWIETADQDGFYLDHDAGMHIVNFYPTFINHTLGLLAGKPFHLAGFQAFTMYNVFAWKKKSDNLRRIKAVYDKRAKKNGKSAEMAGLALYCMSFEMEMEAQIYVGATKEEQARICWEQTKMFIESPVANKNLKKLGFYCQQRIIGNSRTKSTMRALGGDSKTQDGINSFLSVIDEYHAHKDDSVKENLESSSVQRSQPLLWHITTAGTNVQSACKRYEDSIIEVLEGRAKMDHLWIMIHDLDTDDDWENELNWSKANPLLGQGLKIERILEEYENAKLQPSKIPNFKTKHLNMWVDAPNVWIPSEIWDANKVVAIPEGIFQTLGSYAGLDLSTTTDISAFVALSEPDDNGDRYCKPWFFCPKENIDKRSRDDKVPYRYWMDQGWLIATPGNMIDYAYIEKVVQENYSSHGIKRIEVDLHNSSYLITNLDAIGANISGFSQSITNMSFPTKELEKLIYQGKILHDGNPIMSWMLSGCITWSDANDNIKLHKGNSQRNGRRIDGIVALVMALGGSLSPEEDKGKYSKPLDKNEIHV